MKKTALRPDACSFRRYLREGVSLCVFSLALFARAGAQGDRPGSASQVIRGIPVQPSGWAVVNMMALSRAGVQMSASPNEGRFHNLMRREAVVPQVPGRNFAPESFAAFPAGVAANPSPSPDITFQAQSDIPAVGTSTSYIPPDTWGAVGTDKVMSVHNNNVRIQDKATGAQLSIVSLNTFWSSTGATGVFDPRVEYDPFNNRWIVTAASNAATSSSSILIGVSQTSDPTGAFTLASFKADAGGTTWADYPQPGFNKNWFVVCVNMFTNSTNSYTQSNALAVDYQKLLLGTVSASMISNLGGFSVQPCLTLSSSEDTLYMPVHVTSSVASYRLCTITGTSSTPVFTLGALKTHTAFGGWVEPVGDILPQMNGTAGSNFISVGDSRIINAVFRGGRIYYTQNVGLPSGGLTHTAAQWVELSSSGADVQGGRIEDPTATGSNGGKWYAYPSIAVNVTGDILVGFSQFASNEFPSAGYAFKDRSDASGTMRDPVIYKAGKSLYWKTFGGGSNRWGDFSNTQVDPSDDFKFWTIQEYADTLVGSPVDNSGRWGTWWAKVTPVSPLPIELALFSGSVQNGSSVLLRWSTVSEVNNFGFDVQKSTSAGAQFQTIPGSFVPGHGTTLLPHQYSYTDQTPGSGRVDYRLKQYDLDGTSRYSEAIAVEISPLAPAQSLPREFSVSQNFPNPFNPSTTIRYSLAQARRVTLEVFNTLGERVVKLVDQAQDAGAYEVRFDGAALASGVYFYRLKAGDFVSVKKLLLER